MARFRKAAAADLHVHSSYSSKPRNQWFLSSLGAAECYTPPEQVYLLQKARGMRFVTITDHDVIEGALEIAHHKDAFVSEEISTRFPGEPAIFHVIALNIDEAIHEDITRCRDNLYELVAYLRQKGVTHFLAHPLFSGDVRLRPEQLERLLLLFNNLEILNGTRIPKQRQILEALFAKLTPGMIERWANKYNIEPVGPQPHRKSVVGGSDDHAGIAMARAYTVCQGARTIDDFLQAINEGRSQAVGEGGSSLTLAHAIYGIGYRYFKAKPQFQSSGNVYMGLFDGLTAAIKGAESEQPAGQPPSFPALLGQQIQQQWKQKKPFSLPRLIRSGHKEALHRALFEFINGTVKGILADFHRRLLETPLASFDLSRFFEPLTILASSYLFLAPYYCSFRHQNGDRKFLQSLESHFGLPTVEAEKKVAIFSDTVFNVNGVAFSLRRMVSSTRKQGREMVLIACSDNPAGFSEGIMNFQALSRLGIPDYPEQILYLPPILDVLDYCEQQGFTTIQISTPGPVGLTGLLVAKMLSLPTLGFYHTDYPFQIRVITEDAACEALAWSYLRWFHRQLDRTMVPSSATLNRLLAHGFESEKLEQGPQRGVDVQFFHPRRRDPSIWHDLAIPRSNGESLVRLLYVGRLSREKNLDFLMESFTLLVHDFPDLALIIVGDGPYRSALEQSVNGHRMAFTGYLTGETLARAYASADIFVFPSASDTFGNVVLEAQASGLPVVVVDQGGAQENMLNGRTGLVAKDQDARSFAAAIQALIEDPALRERLGQEARIYAESRSLEGAVEDLWTMYQ